jgi:hypothetical protein
VTVYADAYQSFNLDTRRFIKLILVILNNNPIIWMSKREKTLETSTYGSEFAASRIATELIFEIRYLL